MKLLGWMVLIGMARIMLSHGVMVDVSALLGALSEIKVAELILWCFLAYHMLKFARCLSGFQDERRFYLKNHRSMEGFQTTMLPDLIPEGIKTGVGLVGSLALIYV
jgi:hypothetical protein